MNPRLMKYIVCHADVYNNISVGAIYYYLDRLKLSRFQMQDNIETLLRYFLQYKDKCRDFFQTDKRLPQNSFRKKF